MLTETLDIELWAEQWLGAVDGARETGCDFVCFCGRALDDSGVNSQANAIYDLVSAQTVDGLVVWTSTLGLNVGRGRVEEFGRQFAPLPIVSVEQSLGQAPVVGMDNRQGMYAVVSHLIEVHGRRDIGFVHGPANHEGAGERYQGYRDALADHGLVVDPRWVSARPSSWEPGEAAASVARMLERGAPPDALAAANDHIALGALYALAAADLRMPDDVAVVGFDDSMNIREHDLWFDSESDTDSNEEYSADRRAGAVTEGALSLTTAHAPFHEMGRRSVEAVLDLIHGETVPPLVKVPTALVVRRSCGCSPHAAPTDALAQERPTIRLRRAARHQATELPKDWPERLTTEFESATRGESNAFLGLLDQLVQSNLRSGEKAVNWPRALTALRQLVERPTSTAAEAVRAEDLWLRAQLSVNEIVERQWRYAQVLTDRRNKIMREVGQRLITASDVKELADVLAEELGKVAVPGCYLGLYESVLTTDAATDRPVQEVSRDRSRLLLAYENSARLDINGDPSVFESVRLVPGGRLDRAAPYSMVAVPLYFQDDQLGYVLFELGPRIGWLYTALQEQIGTALHRALMVERERLAHIVVQEAHRREERHRLAGELHDSVSQALFSMTLHTRAVQLAVQQGEDQSGRVLNGLAELRDLTQGALADMRALIFQLRPDALHEEGLVTAIRRHAAAVSVRTGLDIDVNAPGDRLPLDERAEEELLRVIQEALHNCVKHAGATHVDIRLMESAEASGTLVVEVADDGAGFDPHARYPGHLGLDGMRERTQRLGGRFAIDSSAGGSTVRAVVPGALPGDSGTAAR